MIPKQLSIQERTGFTLIELIMIIVVLGILTAVAIPFFFDLSTESRNASDDGNIAAVRTTILNLHATSALSGPATWPNRAQIEANMQHFDFNPVVVTGEWVAWEFFGGNIISFNCPHTDAPGGRRQWLYFRTAIGSWQPGDFVEITAGPHS